MSDGDRCANCGAVIDYEVHFNPAGEGAEDGRRFCSVGCAAAGEGEPGEAEERAAKKGGER